MPRPEASGILPASRPERSRCSFDERPSREAQEDVLERRATHERRERLEPEMRDALERGLAVVGVDEDAVGEHLDPVADTLELPGDLRVAVGAEAHLEHLAARVLADERGGGALGHDAALVDDDE